MKGKYSRNFRQPLTRISSVTKYEQDQVNPAHCDASHQGAAISLIWKGQVHVFSNKSDYMILLGQIREKLGIPSMYQELMALYDLHSQKIINTSSITQQQTIHALVLLFHPDQSMTGPDLQNHENLKHQSENMFKRAYKLLSQYSAKILPKYMPLIAQNENQNLQGSYVAQRFQHQNYVCPFLSCLRSFDSLKILKLHLCKIHQFPSGLKCDNCSLHFSKKIYLQWHQKQKQSREEFCGDCGLRVNSTCSLMRHRMKHRAGSLQEIDQEQEAITSCRLQENREEQKQESSNPPVKLQAETPKRGNFSRQTSYQTKIKKDYLCPFCQRHFKKKFSLQDHLFSHSNSKSYVCQVCGKNFKRERTLKVHQKNLHADLILQYPQLAAAKRDVKPQIFKEDEQVVGFPKGTVFGHLQHLYRDKTSTSQENAGGQEVQSERIPGSLPPTQLSPLITKIQEEWKTSNSQFEQLVRQNQDYQRAVTQLDLAKRYLELEQLKKICLYQESIQKKSNT